MAELKEKWREIVPRFRILCLSELNDVTSMWNHYADEYRGVVLEFEAVDQLDSVFLVARLVTYQDVPPAIEIKKSGRDVCRNAGHQLTWIFSQTSRT